VSRNGTSEGSLSLLVHAKGLALRAQLAAMGVQIARLEQSEQASKARAERTKSRHAWGQAARLVGEHAAEQKRREAREFRTAQDRRFGTPPEGYGYSHGPDGQRLNVRFINLARESGPECAAAPDAPSATVTYRNADTEAEAVPSVAGMPQGTRIIT
jgi:hypothetical protein